MDDRFCEQSGRERWGCIHCQYEGTDLPDPDDLRRLATRAPLVPEVLTVVGFEQVQVVWVGVAKSFGRRPCHIDRSHVIEAPGLIGNVKGRLARTGLLGFVGWCCTACCKELPRSEKVEPYFQRKLAWLEGVTAHKVRRRYDPTRVRFGANVRNPRVFEAVPIR